MYKQKANLIMQCYVKFGAVRPEAGDAGHFDALLDSSSSLATAVGMPNLLAGVNLAREEAYMRMLAYGFRLLEDGSEAAGHPA